MIEVDYKDEIDVELIDPGESIYIVDFSFKPDVMKRVLKRTKKIVWIDHHKTADEYDYGVELEGLRVTEDKKYAGCELTWMYLYPNTPIPIAVQYVGDRDKWAWKLKKWSAPFTQGLAIHPHQPGDEIWDSLLSGTSGLITPKVDEMIREGETCIRFRDSIMEDYCRRYGFETIFEDYNCFARGFHLFGSEGFGKRFYEYSICIAFEYLGDKYIVGLYSEHIDVGEIAKKYGGGGHKGASGFTCNSLPFKKEIHVFT